MNVTILWIHNPEIKKEISISPLTTIGELKQKLNPLMGYFDTQLRFVFNNNVELNSIVFTTNNYDNVNFQQYSNVLMGSKIYVSKLVTPPDSRPIIYILLDENTDYLYGSTNKAKVLQYFAENHIRNTTGFYDINEMISQLYGIETPIDYNNQVQQEYISDAIMEADYNLVEGKLD